MSSHHFLGAGALSEGLEAAASKAPEKLLARVAELVEASEMKVVGRQLVAFENGGMTLVWVLAESHLVLHCWAAEGYATIDLHVCDYRRSNAAKAVDLRRRLDEFCFAPGSSDWRELHLERPSRSR